MLVSRVDASSKQIGRLQTKSDYAGHRSYSWESQSSSGRHRAEHCHWADQVSMLSCLGKDACPNNAIKSNPEGCGVAFALSGDPVGYHRILFRPLRYEVWAGVYLHACAPALQGCHG